MPIRDGAWACEFLCTAVLAVPVEKRVAPRPSVSDNFPSRPFACLQGSPPVVATDAANRTHVRFVLPHAHVDLAFASLFPGLSERLAVGSVSGEALLRQQVHAFDDRAESRRCDAPSICVTRDWQAGRRSQSRPRGPPLRLSGEPGRGSRAPRGCRARPAQGLRTHAETWSNTWDVQPGGQCQRQPSSGATYLTMLSSRCAL